VDWQNTMQILTTNGPTLIAPLIVSLVAGFILGWLLAYLPARRSNSSLREQNTRLESSLTKIRFEGEETRGQIDTLRGELRSVTANQADLRNQLLAAEESKAEVARTIQQRDAAVDDLTRQITLAQDEFEQVESRSHATLLALSAELESAKASLVTKAAENDRLTGDFTHAQAELANVRQALLDRPQVMEALRAAADQASQEVAGKQTALDEAYSRAATLLQTVEERNAHVASLEAQLGERQGEIDKTIEQRRALEARLQSVRGDVASEMVRVTQALIKGKDEQLSEANERYEALLMELTALKREEN